MNQLQTAQRNVLPWFLARAPVLASNETHRRSIRLELNISSRLPYPLSLPGRHPGLHPPTIFRLPFLGGHLKTGHRWALQNRPTEPIQDTFTYTLAGPVMPRFSGDDPSGRLILTSPGRRVRQRRDATGAPTQQPEWRGDESRPPELLERP